MQEANRIKLHPRSVLRFFLIYLEERMSSKEAVMSDETSNRLKRNSARIVDLWEKRAMKEINAATFQGSLALRESLSDFISHLAGALSNTIDRTTARIRQDLETSTSLGQKHGRTRATSFNYTLDQLIFEYHILRQVIFDVMEKEVELNPVEREVIVCAVEQAVNDAATEFSIVLRDIQEQLSHTLAHDLRGPISTAKASAQLILRRPDDQNNCIDKASRINSSMDRLDKMIRDLLDASRIRAGERIALELKNCDLSLIAREVAEDFNLGHIGKVVVLSPGRCIGYWNENGLRRIIENLTNNAIKYGQESTPVTISIAQDDSSATLSVHNEGEVISSDEEAILFQQYKRSSKTEKKRVGWGIGLTIVQGMLDAHGGTVKVVSEEGRGTTFIIVLPKNLENRLLQGQENQAASS